jgi:hypothetical protein
MISLFISLTPLAVALASLLVLMLVHSMISLFISLTPLAVALASLLVLMLVHIAPKRQGIHAEQPLTLVSWLDCIFSQCCRQCALAL